jgi:hypothetical protein
MDEPNKPGIGQLAVTLKEDENPYVSQFSGILRERVLRSLLKYDKQGDFQVWHVPQEGGAKKIRSRSETSLREEDFEERRMGQEFKVFWRNQFRELPDDVRKKAERLPCRAGSLDDFAFSESES